MINSYLEKYVVNKKQIYKNVYYPEIDIHDNDIHIISVDGDRLDMLSNEFYQTTDNWWIISVANNLNKSSLYVEAGLQLRIPYDIDKILYDFEQLNITDVDI